MQRTHTYPQKIHVHTFALQNTHTHTHMHTHKRYTYTHSHLKTHTHITHAYTHWLFPQRTLAIIHGQWTGLFNILWVNWLYSLGLDLIKIEILVLTRCSFPIQFPLVAAPYVKVYLLNNGAYVAKKKTKIARKTLDPLYQQALLFEESPQGKVLQVSGHLLRCRLWTWDWGFTAISDT